MVRVLGALLTCDFNRQILDEQNLVGQVLLRSKRGSRGRGRRFGGGCFLCLQCSKSRGGEGGATLSYERLFGTKNQMQNVSSKTTKAPHEHATLAAAFSCHCTMSAARRWARSSAFSLRMVATTAERQGSAEKRGYAACVKAARSKGRVLVKQARDVWGAAACRVAGVAF